MGNRTPSRCLYHPSALLRRTFAAFPPAERRQMTERVKQGATGQTRTTAADLDTDRAAFAFPLIAQLLGLELSP